MQRLRWRVDENSAGSKNLVVTEICYMELREGWWEMGCIGMLGPDFKEI